jgi:hypothetical protein
VASVTIASMAAVGAVIGYSSFRSRPSKGLPVVAQKLPPTTSNVGEARLRADLDELATLPPHYIMSSLAAVACGGPDIALNLALAVGKDLSVVQRLGILDLTNNKPLHDALVCGDRVRLALVAPSVVSIVFADGNERHEVRVLRAKLEELPVELGFVRHNFSGLAGQCLRTKDAKTDCQDDAFASVHDRELWVFGKVPAVESFARSYTTAREELSTNLDILQTTIANTQDADSVSVEARPESIPWKAICEIAAPIGNKTEFVEACFPGSQERTLSQIESKVRGLAVERDLVARAATVGLTFVLVARDEAAAKEIETDLHDLARDWRAHLANREPQLVKLVRAHSDFVHDKLWNGIFDAYLRAIKGMTVTRSGETVRLVMREHFRPAEEKALSEILAGRTQDQLATIAVVDAVAQGTIIPTKSLAVFTGLEIAAWITAPRAKDTDCDAILAKIKTLTPAELSPEQLGLKVEAEKRFTKESCVGAVLPAESRACFDGATDLQAFSACRLPSSPFVMAAVRKVEGQWAVDSVKSTAALSTSDDRWLKSIKLEFANGRVAFSSRGGDIQTTDADIASKDVDGATFNLPLLRGNVARKTIRFVGSDTLTITDMASEVAISLKHAKFDGLLSATKPAADVRTP